MKYYKTLVGQKCYLSPLNLEDVEQYTEWLNDLEVSLHLGMRTLPLSREKEREMLERILKDEHSHVFAIVDRKADKLIGNCGLHNVDSVHRSAEFGIFIGDKSFWNRGYGEDATRLMLDYGFNLLNLKNIMLSVLDFNRRAVRCYEKCGFQTIGKRRQCRAQGARVFDMIFMDILAEEYQSVYVQGFIE
jgi:RimJ/RimL family protein N-acetyltransferase